MEAFAQIEHVSTQKKVMKVSSAPNHDPTPTPRLQQLHCGDIILWVQEKYVSI